MTALTPCLWFDTEAQDAANFYLTVFPNSRITDTTYYGEAGPRPGLSDKRCVGPGGFHQ